MIQYEAWKDDEGRRYFIYACLVDPPHQFGSRYDFESFKEYLKLPTEKQIIETCKDLKKHILKKLEHKLKYHIDAVNTAKKILLAEMK